MVVNALLLTAGLVQAAPAPFDSLLFLVGHCWEGTFPDGEPTDRHCFEWVYGDKFVRDRHVVHGKDGPYEGETLYAWDAERNALVFHYWSSDGGTSEGTIAVEGGTLVFPEERHRGEDGTERVFRSRWDRDGDDGFLALTEERREGAWVEAWSVDYRRLHLSIAFNSDRDGNYEVYLMERDGTAPENVSRHESTDWVYASYDGALLTASSREGGLERGMYRLYRVEADGSERRRLSFPVYDSFLGRSPDGKRYVVGSRREGRHDLFVLDETGNELVRLTNDAFKDSDPDWSPDGSTIVFRSDRGGAMDLWLMDAGGANLRRLTSDPANDDVHGYGGEGPARFSPDGRSLVWMHWRGNWDVCIMVVASRETRCLTEHPSADSYPSWSPDGSEIVFDSNRDGNYEIYVMRSDGSDVRRLTEHPGDDQAPVFVELRARRSPSRSR